MKNLGPFKRALVARGSFRTLTTQNRTEGAPDSSFDLGLEVSSDLAFFLFVSHPQRPFTRPNDPSTLNFDHSLQNT